MNSEEMEEILYQYGGYRISYASYSEPVWSGAFALNRKLKFEVIGEDRDEVVMKLYVGLMEKLWELCNESLHST